MFSHTERERVTVATRERADGASDARTALRAARARYDAMRRRAEALRARVDEALTRTKTAREGGRAGGTEASARRASAVRSRAVMDATVALERVRTRVMEDGGAVEARERWLRVASAALRDAERTAFEVEVPFALAEAEGDFRRVKSRLDVEMERVMRQLRALLPVRTESAEGSARGGAASRSARSVRAGGCKVPDAFDGEGFDAHELAAGLGTLMHFSALASRYLDAPRLHRGSHAASQSLVWAPTSAWDDTSASVWENNGTVHIRDFAGANAEVLPLFLPRAVVDGSGEAANAAVRESRLRLKRAMRLLARSVAVTSAHQARECGVIAPAGMGPFSQLCALTAAVARGGGGVARSVPPPRAPTPPHVLHNSTNEVATAHRGSPELLEANVMMQSITEGVVFDAGGAKRSALATSIMEASRRWLCERPPSRARDEGFTAIEEDDFESVDENFFATDLDCADGIDDWDSIHVDRVGWKKSKTREAMNAAKPPRNLVLPPPPSSEDIEHWERAMLVDNKR